MNDNILSQIRGELVVPFEDDSGWCYYCYTSTYLDGIDSGGDGKHCRDHTGYDGPTIKLSYLDFLRESPFIQPHSLFTWRRPGLKQHRADVVWLFHIQEFRQENPEMCDHLLKMIK